MASACHDLSTSERSPQICSSGEPWTTRNAVKPFTVRPLTTTADGLFVLDISLLRDKLSARLADRLRDRVFLGPLHGRTVCKHRTSVRLYSEPEME